MIAFFLLAVLGVVQPQEALLGALACNTPDYFCNQQFYSCDRWTTGLTCRADEWCAVTRGANYFTFENKEILASNGDVWSLGDARGWGSYYWGAELLRDPDYIPDLRGLYYSSACFRLENEIRWSSGADRAVYPGGRADLSAVAHDRYWCHRSLVLIGCDRDSNGYRYVRTRESGQRAAAAVLRISPPRQWEQRGTALIEDVLVLSRFTREQARSYCAAVGASLYRYHSPQQAKAFFDLVVPQFRSDRAQVFPPGDFWVGLTNGRWDYDDVAYNEQVPRDGNGRYGLYKFKDNNPAFGTTSDENARLPFACTRSMVPLRSTVPARCYRGLDCVVRFRLDAPVAEHMSDFGAAMHFSVERPFQTGFHIQKGAADASIRFRPGSAGDITWEIVRRKGFRAQPRLVAAQQIHAPIVLQVVDPPARLFVGQSNRFTVRVPPTPEAFPSVVRDGQTTAAGALTTGPFGANREAVVTFTPSATASSATLALSVAATCDCGEACNCYESPIFVRNIVVTEQDEMGLVSSSPVVLGAAGNVTLAVRPPTAVVAATTVTLSDSCGLRYSPTATVTFAAGDTLPVQVVVESPPGGYAAAVTCVIERSLRSDRPQYTGISPLSLVVGPHVSVTFVGLQDLMTTFTSYTFSITLSAVYAGLTLQLTPTCGAAVVSPGVFTFSSAELTTTFTIIGTSDFACTVSLAPAGPAAPQLLLGPLPSLSFVTDKVTAAALPPVLYVGHTYELVLHCAVTGIAKLNITGRWVGDAGTVDLLALHTVLNASAPTARFPLRAIANGTGTFVFTLFPAVVGYRTQVGSVAAAARHPLVSRALPAALPAAMSTGPFFATTVTFDIGALPGPGHNVTLRLTYPLGVFRSEPAEVVWRGSDPAYSARSITLFATAATNASSVPVGFTVSGTTPQFVYGNYSLGLVSTYHRTTIAPAESTMDVYGSPVGFTLAVDLSAPSAEGPLVLTVAFPSSQISGPTSLYFAANETRASLAFTTVAAVANSARFDIALAIDADRTGPNVSRRFDTRINATSVLVLPYLPIVQRCNATEVYFGPYNAIVCNYTIESLPPSGTVLELAPRTSDQPPLAPSAAAAAFSPAFVLTFVFQPVAAFAFADGQLESVAVAVQDTSRRYAPADLIVTFACRKLIAVTAAQPVPGAVYVSTGRQTNTFALCVTLAELPVGDEAVRIPLHGIGVGTTSTGALLFVPGGPLTQCFDVNATVVGSFVVVLPVLGSPRFVAEAAPLALTVLALERVTFLLTETVLFANQTAPLSIVLGTAPAADTTLNVALAVLCDGVPTAAVLEGPSTVALTATTAVVLRARGVCANSSIVGTLSGTTTIFDLDRPPAITALSLRPLKVATAAISKATLYGGGVDTMTLTVQVSELPLAAASLLRATIASTPAMSVVLQLTTLEFLQTGSSASASREVRVAAAGLVSVPTDVALSVVFSGPASGEYRVELPAAAFTVTLRPMETVALALDFTPAVIYVSPALVQTMRVSIGTAPSQGSLTVTPILLRGSPTAVRFTPPTVRLNASIMAATITVEALASTASDEALSVAIAGDAVGYFPPAPLPAHAVTFRALGVVRLLEAPPASLFETRTVTLYLQISYPPPPGFADVVIGVHVNDTSAITVGTSEVRWSAGDTVLQKAVSLLGVAVSPAVAITFSLGAPPIFAAQLPSSTTAVLSQRAILVSAPAFVYVGLAITCTISIVRPPPGAGAALTLSLIPSDAAAVRVANVFPFTAVSALEQSVAIEGVEARPAGAAPLLLTVTLFSGAQHFDVPAPLRLEVRPPETILVRGVAAGMYVGSSTVVTFTLQRPPQCPGGELTITPTFASTDAAVSPAAGVTFRAGELLLAKSVTLTALQVTGAHVPITFPLSGSCRAIYAPPAVVTVAVRIFSREVMAVTSWTNASATTGEGGVRFVYVGSSIPITIDLGSPAVRHEGVVVGLRFTGPASAVAFDNDTVAFPPGLNRTTVWVRGLEEADAAAVLATVLVGSHAFVSPSTPLRLRVLKRIPVRLDFVPAAQLIVADTALTLSVAVESTALLGTLTVTLNYGPEITADTVVFEPRTTILSKQTTVRGVAVVPVAKPLTLVLTGPAAPFYVVVTPPLLVPVYPQRMVEIAGGGPPPELFVTPANQRVVSVALQTLPTIPTDIITVTIAPSPALTCAPATFFLSASSPTAAVTLTGVAAGHVDLQALVLVSSLSSEYAPRLNATAPVTVLALLKAALIAYGSTMYVSESSVFTVLLPRAPLWGPLVVTPRLVNSPYPLGMSPPSATVPVASAASAGPIALNFTLQAGIDTLTQTPFEVAASGSSEYAAQLDLRTLRINPATQIGFADFRPDVYIGSTNAWTFTVTVARPPTGGENMTITFPTSESFTMSPPALRFGPGAPRQYAVRVQGRSPSRGALTVVPRMDDPTAFFDPPAPLSLQVLPLESYGGSVSTSTVFVGATTTAVLTFSKRPVGPVGVELVLLRLPSLEALDASAYSVAPARFVTATAATQVAFVVTALAAPASLQLTFRTTGPATSQFFILSIPEHAIQFAPLQPITADLPARLYVGLATVVRFRVPSAPTVGSVRVSAAAPSGSGIVFEPANALFLATTAPEVPVSVTAATTGSFAVVLTTQNTQTTAFMPTVTPAVWNVQVEPPYPLDIVDPPAFVYAFAQNKLSIAVDYGTLLPGETITMTLVSNVSDADLVVFPRVLEVPASAAVFQIHSTAPLYAALNLTFSASARRLVLSRRLAEGSLVVRFRPLKEIAVQLPSDAVAVVGVPVPLAITVSPAPSAGSSLTATLEYGGSPSNVALPPPLTWEATSPTSARQLAFAGRSPTTAELVRLVFANDPQYNLTSLTFGFRFTALWQITPVVPLAVFEGSTAPVSFALDNGATLGITMALSILGVLAFYSDASATRALLNNEVVLLGDLAATVYMVPAQVRATTITFTLGYDDAAKFAVPSPRTVTVESRNTVLLDASSLKLVAYIAPTIAETVTVKIASLPTVGTLTVTPQLSCAAGQIVSFSPAVVFFNASQPLTSQPIRIRGLIASPPCDVAMVVGGTATGYVGSSQRLTVETRALHTIDLLQAPTRIFTGPTNRVPLRIALDGSVRMPLQGQIAVTFQSLSPCITVTPSGLFWAAGNMEDLTKIAFLQAVCTGARLGVRITLSAPNVFVSRVPAVMVLDALPLLSASVVDATSGSTDYFMYVGGAPLDLDVSIPEALDPTESLTVAAVYEGIGGSLSTAPAVWVPSPVPATAKKLLLQALAVSPRAPIRFIVSGPPRFERLAGGAGNLEVFGPKRVVASVPATLIVGQSVVVGVTIEDLPYPSETIVVTPTWEGLAGAVTWTPPQLQWTSTSVGRELFFQLTPHAHSEAYNFIVRVSGSYRFVPTAYSGPLSVRLPQRILTTSLPSELMRGQRYRIGVDIAVAPPPGQTLFVRLTPQLSDQLIDCVALDTTELAFTGLQGDPTLQFVGVTAVRPCSSRFIHFKTLGSALAQYDAVVTPRAFTTIEADPVAVQWPALLYVGPENGRDVVISQRIIFYDETEFLNLSITANESSSGSGGGGPLQYARSLSWVYGTKASKAFRLVGSTPGVVAFAFSVVSSHLTSSVPPHVTRFLPLIALRPSAASAPPEQIYVGDVNKLPLAFTVSDVPRIIGSDEAAPVFHLVATSSDPNVVLEPSSLRWSADSPLEQFLFVRASAPTAPNTPATIRFAVQGDGAHLVQAVPPPLQLRAVPLLLVDFTVAPSALFVGPANRQAINVSVPDAAEVRLLIGIEGETTAFKWSPERLHFGGSSGNPARWALVTVEALYPTSRASFMKYTLLSAPPRIAVRPMAATETLFAVGLVEVRREPSADILTLYEHQTFHVALTPVPPGLACVTTDPGLTILVDPMTAASPPNVVALMAPRPLTATVTCTSTDTTYAVGAPFTVRVVSRHRLGLAPTIATYVGVQARLPVTVTALPSSGKLIVQATVQPASGGAPPAVSVSPPYVIFTPTSSTSQYLLVTGLELTEGGLPANISYTVSGPVHEYALPPSPLLTTAAAVIERLTVGHCVGAVCTAFTNASSADPIVGYVQPRNAIRVQFRIPRPTLFSDIAITGDTVGLATAPVFCARLDPCVPITANTPLILTTNRALVTAFVFSPVPLANVPLRFLLRGSTDFYGPTAITAGLLTLQPLERVVVDTAALRSELFVGGANAQDIPVRITGPPLPGQNVEIVVLGDPELQLSTPLLTWAATSGGVMHQPLVQTLRVISTAAAAARNRSVTFQWRDRLSITSASNFEEALSASAFAFDLLPLIAFRVTVDGRVPAQGEVFPAYLGEVNAVVLRIALDRLPVRETDEVLVSIVVANPDFFKASTSVLRFGHRVGGGTARLVRVWATGMYDPLGTNNTVIVRITGPEEFKQDLFYIVRLRVHPLLVMQHDLAQTTIAVGSENAVTFRMWPPVPVDLTLNSLVTCGEVSFTAAEQLKWENSMTPKRLTVAGTLPTGPDSRCFLQTPVMSGLSATKFSERPLQVQMWTRARPRVLAQPPDGIAGSDVRASGLRFAATLSEGGFWRWNDTDVSATAFLRHGLLRIRSTRDAGAEPNSVQAMLDRQLRGELAVPFFTLALAAPNVLTVAMGPHPTFYASARETITMHFTAMAIHAGVTLDPLQDTVTFEIRGRKESLIGGGGNNVLGSGAASAAIAGGALSMGAATAAGKLQVIMNAFLCPNPDWRDLQDSVDWNEAPIPLRFGTNADLGVFVAVAFSNTLVILGCLALHLVIAYIVYRVRQRYAYRSKSYATARGVVRFPSLMLFPILFFYQAIISSSFKVIMYSPVMAFRFIGALTFLGVGFSVPGVVYAVVGPGFTARYLWREARAVEEDAAADRHHLPTATTGNKKLTRDSDHSADKATAAAAPNGASRVFLYLFQPVGQWAHRDKLWLEAYGMFFDEFRGGYHWFVLVDVALTFLLGVIDGFEPASLTECYGRLSATVLLFFLQFVSLVIYRPYSNRFLNGFFIFAYFLQFLSMVLVAAAVISNTPQNDGVKVAVNLLLFFSAMLMVKSILDLFRMLNDHFNFAAMFVIDRERGYVLRDTLTEAEEAALGDDLVQALKAQRLRRAQARALLQDEGEHDQEGDSSRGGVVRDGGRGTARSGGVLLHALAALDGNNDTDGDDAGHTNDGGADATRTTEIKEARARQRTMPPLDGPHTASPRRSQHRSRRSTGLGDGAPSSSSICPPPALPATEPALRSLRTSPSVRGGRGGGHVQGPTTFYQQLLATVRHDAHASTTRSSNDDEDSMYNGFGRQGSYDCSDDDDAPLPRWGFGRRGGESDDWGAHPRSNEHEGEGCYYTNPNGDADQRSDGRCSSDLHLTLPPPNDSFLADPRHHTHDSSALTHHTIHEASKQRHASRRGGGGGGGHRSHVNWSFSSSQSALAAATSAMAARHHAHQHPLTMQGSRRRGSRDGGGGNDCGTDSASTNPSFHDSILSLGGPLAVDYGGGRRVSSDRQTPTPPTLHTSGSGHGCKTGHGSKPYRSSHLLNPVPHTTTTKSHSAAAPSPQRARPGVSAEAIPAPPQQASRKAAGTSRAFSAADL